MAQLRPEKRAAKAPLKAAAKKGDELRATESQKKCHACAVASVASLGGEDPMAPPSLQLRVSEPMSSFRYLCPPGLPGS